MKERRLAEISNHQDKRPGDGGRGSHGAKTGDKPYQHCEKNEHSAPKLDRAAAPVDTRLPVHAPSDPFSNVTFKRRPQIASDGVPY